MSARFSNPFPQFFNSTPQVLSGAKLFFYEAGSSTKLDTYSDAAETVPNTNPVVLNASGYPPTDIFLKNQAYKVVLAPSTDSDPPLSPIWTADAYYGTDLQSVTQTKTGSGSPSGVVAGTAGSAGVLPTMYWDYTNAILYVCTVTGDAATAGWTALNASAATPSVPAPQGYLTLTSGTPVITSDVVSATTVYYTPDKGNLIPIYNGATLVPTEFAELSLSLVASHAASTIYDLFVFSNSGVLTLVTGPAWNTSTAGAGSRGTGAGTTQLTRVEGLFVNAVQMTGRNGATTYSIGANLATYVGSIFMDGSAGQVTCHREFGQSRKWGLWNAHNRRPLYLIAGDATASWTYNTATIRASNNASANSLSVFSGLAEEIFDLSFGQKVNILGHGGELANGIGWNSTTAFSGRAGNAKMTGATSSNADENHGGNLIANYMQVPQLGVNVVTALEKVNDATNLTTATWFGSNVDMQLTARWMG